MRIVSSLKSNILLASLIGAFVVNPCTVLAETSTGQANDLFATNVENSVVINRGHKIVPYVALQYKKDLQVRYETNIAIPTTKLYTEYRFEFNGNFSGLLELYDVKFMGTYYVAYYTGVLRGSGL